MAREWPNLTLSRTLSLTRAEHRPSNASASRWISGDVRHVVRYLLWAGVVSRNIQRKPSSLQTSPSLGCQRVDIYISYLSSIRRFSKPNHNCRHCYSNGVIIYFQWGLIFFSSRSTRSFVNSILYRFWLSLETSRETWFLSVYRTENYPRLVWLISKEHKSVEMIPETLKNVKLLGEYISHKQQRAIVSL